MMSELARFDTSRLCKFRIVPLTIKYGCLWLNPEVFIPIQSFKSKGG